MDPDASAFHQPVLLAEVVELLAPERGGLFVDATLGLGGHAEALLEAGRELRLLGIDQDPQALELAARRLARFGERVRLVAGNFRHLGELVAGARWGAPAGILADLGVSSLQLERGERGFSFRRDGPLDMRMGAVGKTAADVVNTYSEAALAEIFQEFGEERESKRVARALVARRKVAPFATSAELAETVRRAKRFDHPGPGREGRIDAATRVFQALRIEVNQELAALPEMLDEAVRLLSAEGRLVVISYHSLEDRIVKHTLRDLARGEVDEVTGRPRAETQLIEVLTRNPVRPSEEEMLANPRSRSARLRAARRL
ncbi:MAG: 16S rRNA (cytosine(1402)-N(4))-methyltransferase RsmH [Thermoanaerobaculia bacterium]